MVDINESCVNYVGDNVAESLAMEAANRLADYEAKVEAMKKIHTDWHGESCDNPIYCRFLSLLTPTPAANEHTEEGE